MSTGPPPSVCEAVCDHRFTVLYRADAEWINLVYGGCAPSYRLDSTCFNQRSNEMLTNSCLIFSLSRAV